MYTDSSKKDSVGVKKNCCIVAEAGFIRNLPFLMCQKAAHVIGSIYTKTEENTKVSFLPDRNFP
jgi:hypothetical protein